MTEKLENEVKEISEKLAKQDALETKKAEKEFRQKMQEDTAGTVMKGFNILHDQIGELQALVAATNPLAGMFGAINNNAAKIEELEARIAKLESGPSE